MIEKRKTYFTTGEFAELCNTTKDTLFHYDRAGILKPEYVSEKNKYRYYSANQFYDYDLIAVLKEAGSSLQQIKEYLNMPDDITYFLNLLKENEVKLLEQSRKLKRMQHTLHNVIEMTEQAISTPIGIPQIRECEEEFYITVKIPDRNMNDEEEVKLLQEHFRYCEEHQVSEDYALGVIVTRQSLSAGRYEPDYYYSKIQEPVGGEHFFIRPKGAYAVMHHTGGYRELKQTYRKLLRFIQEQGYRVSGHSYEYELVGYMAFNDEKKFIIEVSIQVEADCCQAHL